jgi:glycosyltransferase involved in cell wall biosynthesis
VKDQNLSANAVQPREVLHYTGADDDRGGVMSVLHALAGDGRFRCLLGVNPGFTQRRTAKLATLELPRIACEAISPGTAWRARAVARVAREWLATDRTRVFHAHSRAGLLVAWWLARGGQRRVVASVHSYGRQRWFYRAAARALEGGLYWLSPAMKRHYGIRGDDWSQCIPGCLPSGTQLQGVKRTNRSHDEVRLGGVGALVRWKGWHWVVEAIASLPENVRTRVRFDHIGAPGGGEDGQRYASDLRALTRSHGLDDRITWRGERVSSDAFLREIDALVVASENEPFSIAVLEALAAGVPVLAADSGGARDLLVAGESGWFFRSGDVSDLARAMQMLAQTDALARVVIRVEQVRLFTAPVVVEKWMSVYAAL